MARALLSFQTALGFGTPSLLLRHAERGAVTDPRTGNDVPLTPQGLGDSVRLGRALGRGSFVAYHSPVHRCRQTAVAIADGISEAGGRSTVAGVMGALGGPYLRSPQEALTLAATMGSRFVRAWFDGEVDPMLVDARKPAADRMLRAMVDSLREPTTSCLFVSHDWNLMAVREEYFGIRHEEAGWLDYLDGVAFVRSESQIVLAYGSEVRRVDLGAPHPGTGE